MQGKNSLFLTKNPLGKSNVRLNNNGKNSFLTVLYRIKMYRFHLPFVSARDATVRPSRYGGLQPVAIGRHEACYAVPHCCRPDTSLRWDATVPLMEHPTVPDDLRHPAIDKSRLPSRHVTVGPERAPHRAFLYSMGLTREQIEDQPLVGVATTWNEAAPCNIALSRQAQAVKKGVAAARGTPREFTTITVTDGIAMGHEGMKSSLISREIIANSVELTMRGHCYDALVGLAGCDKSLPGMMMAMVRLNVPSVFMYGGSILPGRFKGKDVTIGDVFEAVGAHNVGKLTDEELHELECVACPSAGSCGGLFTANTMACRLRGDRAGPARLGRRAGALRFARRLCRGLGPDGHGAAAPQPAPARHRDPESARKRRHRRRRGRRLDQCRAAPAGDRQRGRDRFRPARGRRDLQAHAVYRRSEARRPLRDEGPARYRRRAGADEGAARRRLSARRLHDRDRQDDRREPCRCAVPDRSGRRAAGVERDVADRRRRRAAAAISRRRGRS